MTNPVLMAVLAHPDDETFGMGGTLAFYASRGVEVYLVCATRGEVGEVDKQHLKGFANVAELRVNELRCAASILGLAGVHFLDYRDSGMPGSPDNHHPKALAAAPLEEVASKVLRYIRRFKPQVVLTFDPIGGYRHPDHMAIHAATLRAFELATRPEPSEFRSSPYRPQRLYYHTMPRAFLRFAVWLLRLIGKDPRRWGANADIDLLSIVDVDFPTHARIDIRSVLDKKEQATACHASQGGGQMSHNWIGRVMRLFGASEKFMRAYPPFQPKEKVERDIFTDVILDK